MIHEKKRAVNMERTASHPATVDEFLRVNPLPAKLRHLEPSFRKLPHAEMMIEILIGCLQHDMSSADFDRIITDVGTMYEQRTQRCAGCFYWTSQFHAIVVGSAGRFATVPMCDECVTKFEAGSATERMQRNLSAYAGKVVR